MNVQSELLNELTRICKSPGHIKTFDFWFDILYAAINICELHLYNVYFILKAESILTNDHDQTNKHKHRKSFPKNIIIY